MLYCVILYCKKASFRPFFFVFSLFYCPLLLFAFLLFFYALDLHCCFHGIQCVFWCVFVNRWEQNVTDRLMMISHNKGSLLSYGPLSIQKDGHTPPVLIFFSQLTVCFNSSFIPSKYYFQSVSSEQGLRYNVHANSTILAAAILFGTFYCRLHSVYASM